MGRKKYRHLYWLALVFVFLLFWLIFFYSPPGGPVYTVQFEKVRDEFATEAVFIRDELVINSPYSGRIELIASEGERLRSGSPIISVGSEEKKVYSWETGLISYKIDGWESILVPGEWSTLDPDILKRVSNDFNAIRQGQRIREGEPVIRVVNNFTLYLGVFIPEDLPLPQAGRRLRVEFPRLDQEIYWGRVVEVNYRERIIFLELSEFTDEFLSLRRQPINVIRSIYTGLAVPREAIIETEDGYGVFMPAQGDPVIRQVEIVGTGNGKVVVEGLSLGDEIQIDLNRSGR